MTGVINGRYRRRQGNQELLPGSPASHEGFHLKGAHQLDWGMRNRLSKIFRPSTGRTVMLAVDHGYFLGPTTGLERIDLTIVPLLAYADALMCTRGILRSSIPSTFPNGVVMRSSGGPSTLKELSNELLAVDIDDALRMNVSAMAVQVYIGGEFETQSVRNMTTLVDMGLRYGVPTMGVTAVGKELTRDARYLGLATRICAELGAQVVKTYYCAEASSASPPAVRCRSSWPAARNCRARGADNGPQRRDPGRRRVDMAATSSSRKRRPP